MNVPGKSMKLKNKKALGHHHHPLSKAIFGTIAHLLDLPHHQHSPSFPIYRQLKEIKKVRSEGRRSENWGFRRNNG